MATTEITFVTPAQPNAPVPPNTPIQMEARSNDPTRDSALEWSANPGGGSFIVVQGNLPGTEGIGPVVIYVTPPSITSADASGNKVFDSITITVTDPEDPHDPVSESTSLLLCKNPRINHTNSTMDPTDDMNDKGSIPVENSHPGGPTDESTPDDTPQDEDNQDEGPCGQVNCTYCSPESGTCCACGNGKSKTGGSGGTNSKGLVPVPTTGSRGERKKPGMYCPETSEIGGSEIYATPAGRIKVEESWGALFARGITIDLGYYFNNVEDGLTSTGLRPAGVRGAFGWFAKVVRDDSTDGLAIYWGGKGVEPFPWNTGTASRDIPLGTFGRMEAPQNNGPYTRATKQHVYYDFDATGRLITIKDRSQNGNVVYYNYDVTGLDMIRITGQGLGFKPYFVYDANHRVTRMSLESSNPSEARLTYYQYDASGRMIKIHGPENAITYFQYDVFDNLSKKTDAEGYVTYFDYVSLSPDRIQQIKMPEGATIYYSYENAFPRQVKEQKRIAGGGAVQELPITGYRSYDWAGMSSLVTTSDPLDAYDYSIDKNGKVTYVGAFDHTKVYFEWDNDGQLLWQKSCAGTRYFTYGQAGRMTSFKDELGRVTYWNYDSRWYQTNWIDAQGKTTYFTRDAFGEMLSKKDRRGNVTYYTYDNQGNHTSTKFADGRVRYYQYNPAAEVIKIIDELGSVAYYDHDNRGRLTKWKDFLDNTTQYQYDRRLNLIAKTDRRGNTAYIQYDGLSRQIAQKSPEVDTAYFTYTATNLKASEKDPNGNVTYFYYVGNTKRLQAVENALKERTYYEYTTGKQVQSVKDARGATMYYTYDCRHRRTSSMDGARDITYFQYDRLDNLVKTIDPRGNVAYFHYDELNRQTARKDAMGQVASSFYDAESNLTASQDELGRHSYFYYDSRDRRFCLEDAQKNRTYFTYEARGLTSSQKDARGNVTYFYFDPNSRQFAVRDARDGVTYTEYDSEADVTLTKTPKGFRTYYTYDKDRRRLSVKTPLSEVTYFAYDAASNQTSLKDARGNLSYFYFDVLNRTFCLEDAKKARTYYAFDASGNRNSLKDPLGRVIYFRYDLANRQIAVTDALGGSKYFTYDTASDAETVKDERGFVTTSTYDALNRLSSVQNPLGALTYYAYDGVGNRVSVKDPVGRLNYFYYDTLNRLSASEDGLQKRTYYTYDQMSNTLSVKNPRRVPSEVGIQYFTYDALNRRVSFKDEVAKVWYYDYDADSNLFVQTNPLLARTYWTYDADERKLSQKDPLSRAWYWTYDQVGNVSSLKDGKVQTTYYQYDAVSLNDRIDYPDATRHYYEYDLGRQRTAMADPTGRTTLSYDALGRMSFRGNPGSQNLYYTYDAASNRTALKDQDGEIQPWTYDGANRMTGVGGTGSGGYGIQPYGTSPYGGGSGSGGTYEYNLANDLVHERRANGAVTYHAYDAAGRISLIQHRKSDGSLIESYTYTRDEAGNILGQLRGSDTITTYWNYDPANRITREAWRTSGGSNVYGFTYSYDDAGNRRFKQNTIAGTTVYWEYDAADQMTRQRSGSPVTVYFTYDANGNLSVEHDVNASAGRTYYDYEPRNLLSRVDFPGATATNYFQYNCLGERVRKDDSTGGKKYTWDGIDVVVEKDLANTTTQRLTKGYTPIAGIGSYAVQEVGSTTIYPHKNQVGTTVRHTDDSQVVANYYEYDAWGQPLLAVQATAQQYRYTQKELDPDFIAFNSENRRHHFPARAYVPYRGIFCQVDPQYLSFHTIHRYIYVEGAPTMKVDPFGLQTTIDPSKFSGSENPPWKSALEKSEADRKKKFDEWHKEQTKPENKKWMELLPPCPCTISMWSWEVERVPGCSERIILTPSPCEILPVGWVRAAKLGYHKAATCCIRSTTATAAGAGQQCCYTADGKLLNNHPDAGTPDRKAPTKTAAVGSFLLPGSFGHIEADVDPYDDALILDGGTPGEHVRKYLEARTPSRGGKDCELNPPAPPAWPHQ